MGYRCEICEDIIEIGTSMCRHIIKRPDGQIDREIPICRDCKAGLKAGYTLPQVRAIRGKEVETSALVEKIIAPSVLKPQQQSIVSAPASKVIKFTRSTKEG